MQTTKALSLTRNVNDWLANTHQPRVLHVFENACNLINEHKDVLSIVSRQIRNGPFNLVVEDGFLFSEHLTLESPVSVSSAQLILGNLSVNMANAKLWNPQPDWKRLHGRKSDILHQSASFSLPDHKLSIPRSLLSEFTTSIVAADVSKACTFAQKMSGLGSGLTPEGDDFIVGAVLAAWIIHPLDIAGALAHEITHVAAPLTTSLSAAWIKSAGRGEAGELWHELLSAFLSDDKMAVEEAVEKISGVGHTSGADALAGFFDVFNSYAEKK